jgi:8-oxo-dGTP pyrophosphatase MutT (NUDIX family)
MEGVLEFGSRDPGADHVLRPGGYTIIFDENGRVAVVATPLGIALPGGGQELGESADAAAVRETLEECGLHIRIDAFLGVAAELVFARDEDMHYRKRCTFLLASVVSTEGSAMESDHELLWLSATEAASKLLHGSQRWAVQEACLRRKL